LDEPLQEHRVVTRAPDSNGIGSQARGRRCGLSGQKVPDHGLAQMGGHFSGDEDSVELVVALHGHHEPEQLVLDLSKVTLPAYAGQHCRRIALQALCRRRAAQRAFVPGHHTVTPSCGRRGDARNVLDIVRTWTALYRKTEQVERWTRQLLAQELLGYRPADRHRGAGIGQGET